MGTIISLNVNNLTIDWGKNHLYSAHSWLYNSRVFQMKYDDFNYYDGALAFSDSLANIKFRLDNLGYSLREVERIFNQQIDIWKKNHDCILNFELFKDIVVNINLEYISDKLIFGNMNNQEFDNFYSWLATSTEENEKYIELKKIYMTNVGIDESDFFDGLDDFYLIKLDRYILLRLLCENDENLKYELNWFCYDLIESGWTTLEDINFFDDKNFIIQHNKLYGKLQKYAISQAKIGRTIKDMDDWFCTNGIEKEVKYIRENLRGNLSEERYTLPTFIRNVVHHPENENNNFSDADLMNSVNCMLEIIKKNNISFFS